MSKIDDAFQLQLLQIMLHTAAHTLDDFSLVTFYTSQLLQVLPSFPGGWASCKHSGTGNMFQTLGVKLCVVVVVETALQRTTCHSTEFCCTTHANVSEDRPCVSSRGCKNMRHAVS